MVKLHQLFDGGLPKLLDQEFLSRVLVNLPQVRRSSIETYYSVTGTKKTGHRPWVFATRMSLRVQK